MLEAKLAQGQTQHPPLILEKFPECRFGFRLSATHSPLYGFYNGITLAHENIEGLKLTCLDNFRTFCCSEEARFRAEQAAQLLAA